jgi:hypothetical protein
VVVVVVVAVKVAVAMVAATVAAATLVAAAVAGVKAGATHGESDELGYQTATGTTTVHDLQATILHLLGIDHTRLTFRTAGVDRRLTDVHGHVVREVLA